jgi:hypothetical protein
VSVATQPDPPLGNQRTLPGISAPVATSLRPDAYVRPNSCEPRVFGHGGPAGGFFYSDSPAIFLGRVGYGPLRVGLDTNVVIDIAEYGPLLLAGAVPNLGAEYAEELDALGGLVNLALVRDVRFYVSSSQLGDARRSISKRQLAERIRVLEALLALTDELEVDATYLGLPDEDDWTVHRRSTRLPLPFIKPPRDRAITEGALAAGCHVLLTRDERDILRHAARISALGMCALRPTDLIDELAVADQLGLPPGPSLDTHRWIHLMEALGDES